MLSLFKSVFLSLVEQVRFGATQVDDFRAPVPVLLLLRAFFAVVSVGDAQPSANDAPALVRAIVALIANPNESARANVGIADDTLAVALLAETADCNPRLLPAHDQIGMMLRHLALSPLPPSFSSADAPSGMKLKTLNVNLD
ncbi:unnamed protein product [Calypogeia fissa]